MKFGVVQRLRAYCGDHWVLLKSDPDLNIWFGVDTEYVLSSRMVYLAYG